MRKVTVAATQMACCADAGINIANAEKLIREAASQGANIILIQELFQTQYFAQVVDYDNLSIAKPVEGNPVLKRFSELAKELDVVLPISFFEESGCCRFNSVMMIDADGTYMGIYRKTHIPDDPGYYEKFYFSPGDTGFRVWDTKYAKIGVGICWDQWFPETARSMALLGAEILLYPTAIGSEPILECDSMPHWRRVMQGHAAANLMPVIAANRIGTETVEPCEGNGGQTSALNFYGSSFIADETGELISEASRDQEEILYSEFDLAELAQKRLEWGLFRDRRPEMYGIIAGKK